MKTKNIFIALMLALLLLPAGAKADVGTFTQKIEGKPNLVTLTYTVEYTPGQSTAIITGFDVSLGVVTNLDLVIPSSCTINETSYNIIGIGANAFKNNTILKTVKFPASIVGIGESAFEGCSNLTAVGFLTTKQLQIGNYAFKGCTQLANIAIPSRTASIGTNAFLNCNSSQGGPTVAIWKASTSSTIAANLLNGQYVKSVEMASGITTIGAGAFRGISNLQSVTLPASLTTIGASAFLGCTSLTSVTIPANVTSIGNNAFDCGNTLDVSVNWMVPIDIPSGTDPFPNRRAEGYVLHVPFGTSSAYGNTYWSTFNSVQSPATYIANNGIIYGWVGDGTNNLTVIGCEGWTQPTNVVIDDHFQFGDSEYTVTEIGYGAFEDCAFLDAIEIPSSITRISINAFLNSGLRSVTFHEGLEIIDTNAFNNTKLTTVNIPSTVSAISSGAFNNCDDLESAYLLGQITYLPNQIFQDCSNLVTVILPPILKTIDQSAFSGCGNLERIELPASLTSMKAAVFKECTKLKDVIFRGMTPPVVDTSLNGDLFVHGDAQSHIDHSTITLHVPFGAIGYSNDSYWGDFNIEMDPGEVVDYQNVKYLCRFNSDGTSYAEVTGLYDSSVTSIAIMESVNNYVGDELMAFPVTKIVSNAFAGNSNLVTVSIPASVNTIDADAFKDCTGLKKVTLTTTLDQFPIWAFTTTDQLSPLKFDLEMALGSKNAVNLAFTSAGVRNIKSVTIGEGIETIWADAFVDCTNMKSVVIPASVSTIATRAFGIANPNYSSALTDVTVEWSEPITINEAYDPFPRDSEGKHSNIKLHVPYGKESLYSSDSYWGTFHILLPSEINIDFADDAVKAVCVGEQTRWDTNGDRELSLAEAAAVTDLYSFFNHNTSITSFDELKYFVGLTTIGDAAFNGCSALTKVTIPEGVTTIGSSAFAFCSVLSEVSMPSTLRTIGYSAFDNTGLADVTIPEGVTSIENSAFEELTGHVTLPSTLVSIGNWAFTNATSVTVSWATPPVESSVNSPFGGNLYNKTLYVPFGRRETYKADSYWGGFGTIKEYGNIPFADDNVKAICVASETGWDTNGDGELSVAEAEAVTSIGQAFGAKAITSFDELKYFTGITTIDNKAFHACSSLVSVTLPKNVTSIGMNAFGSCTALAAIVIPQGVTTISNSAFANCTSLNSVELPWTLETIGSDAFYGTTALERITIPSSVTSMNDAFNGSGLKYVTVYWGGEWTDPIAISENTFTSRYTATLFVPEGTEEEYRAADYWKDFPNIVTKIEFNDPKVKAICVAPATGWDTNHDGELTYDEAAAVTTLGTAFTGNTEIETFGELKYFTGLKWGDVPALTGGDNQHGAFDGCTNLRFVVLPSNIKQIMNFSFRGCTSLANVNIPSGVHTILDDAFQGCTALSYASMPQALKSIGAHAFDGCSSLRWMAFPNHVISYGDQAFNGCSSLTQVTVNSSVPGVIDGDPFPTRADISLTVPAHAAATYQATDYWKEFKNFQEQEPNWTGEFTDANGDIYQYETGYYAQLKHHAASSSRTTFTVLSQVTVDGTDYPVRSISENAIKASYLTTLTIPASITTVKRDAFSCQPTTVGMTLKTIIMQGSVPPTATGFESWENDLTSYNMYMVAQQHSNPDLQFTPLSLKDITLKVPAGAKTAYEADNVWKKFTIEELTPGDGNANGDDTIDINDVLAIVDYILGKTVEGFDRTAADITGDGEVTIADATAVLAIILRQ